MEAPKKRDFTYFELKHEAFDLKLENKFLRHGQSLMIVLGDWDYDLYTKISQTEADCFYDDSKILNFSMAVQKHLKEISNARS